MSVFVNLSSLLDIHRVWLLCDVLTLYFSGYCTYHFIIDGMLITGSDPAAIASLKQHLQFEFEMKDLGFLRYFLRIEVAYSSRGYLLSHQKYIVDFLDRAI